MLGDRSARFHWWAPGETAARMRDAGAMPGAQGERAAPLAGNVETVAGDYAERRRTARGCATAPTSSSIWPVSPRRCGASDYYAGNVQAAESMARAAGAVPRFVHVSSLAAVGPSPEGEDVTEDDRAASGLGIRPVEARGRAIRPPAAARRRGGAAAGGLRPAGYRRVRDAALGRIAASICASAAANAGSARSTWTTWWKD